MFWERLVFILLAHNILVTGQVSVPSLFVPEEYVSNTFEVSIAGNDATATTYLFDPGCEDFACGPVTLIQGPTTAIYSEANVPPGGITTVWSCALSPSGEPTTADCTLTSHWPNHDCCSGSDTKQYPPGTGFAFPTYRAILTAGSVTGVAITAASSSPSSVASPSETASTASSTASFPTEATTTASVGVPTAPIRASSFAGTVSSGAGAASSGTGTATTPTASSTQSVASGTGTGGSPTGSTYPSRFMEVCIGLIGGMLWL